MKVLMKSRMQLSLTLDNAGRGILSHFVQLRCIRHIVVLPIPVASQHALQFRDCLQVVSVYFVV